MHHQKNNTGIRFKESKILFFAKPFNIDDLKNPSRMDKVNWADRAINQIIENISVNQRKKLELVLFDTQYENGLMRMPGYDPNIEWEILKRGNIIQMVLNAEKDEASDNGIKIDPKNYADRVDAFEALYRDMLNKADRIITSFLNPKKHTPEEINNIINNTRRALESKKGQKIKRTIGKKKEEGKEAEKADPVNIMANIYGAKEIAGAIHKGFKALKTIKNKKAKTTPPKPSAKPKEFFSD